MSKNSEPEFSVEGLNQPWSVAHPAAQIKTADLLIIGLVIVGWVFYLNMQFGAANAGNDWHNDGVDGPANAVAGFYMSTFGYVASIIGLVGLVAVRRYSWAAIGFSAVSQVAVLSSISAWLFFYLLSNSFLVAAIETPGADQALENLGNVNDAIREDPLRAVLFWIVVWLLKPAAQHIVFRGWLFAWARVRFKFLDAAIISSLAFAAAQVAIFDHFMEFSAAMAAVIYAVYFFVSGMALCLMTEVTRSIWPGIIVAPAVPLIFGIIAMLGGIGS